MTAVMAPEQRIAQCVDCGVDVAVESIPGVAERFLSKIPRRCPEHQARVEAVWQREWELEEQARVEALLRDRRAFSGLPAALRELGMETLAGRPRTREAVERWAHGDLRGLLLLGAVGTGKTFTAAVAAWARLETQHVTWMSASAMVAALSSAFGSDERRHALEVVAGHGALILDDLDKPRPTEHVAEFLLLAIDNRVNAGSRLLVTMNTAGEELLTRLPEPYGEAIVSRLEGYCETIKLAGADRRVKA